jgi:acylphosphatase
VNKTCVHGYVSGRVQGVWYRGFVANLARDYELLGWAKNLGDGRVEILLCGEADNIEAVIEQLHVGPPAARVDRVEIQPHDCDSSVQDFRVL